MLIQFSKLGRKEIRRCVCGENVIADTHQTPKDVNITVEKRILIEGIIALAFWFVFMNYGLFNSNEGLRGYDLIIIIGSVITVTLSLMTIIDWTRYRKSRTILNSIIFVMNIGVVLYGILLTLMLVSIAKYGLPVE